MRNRRGRAEEGFAVPAALIWRVMKVMVMPGEVVEAQRLRKLVPEFWVREIGATEEADSESSAPWAIGVKKKTIHIVRQIEKRFKDVSTLIIIRN